MNAAIILAAGRGSRLQDSTPDKTLAHLAGRPVITYPIEAFIKSDCVHTIAIIYRDDQQRQAIDAALAEFISPPHELPDILWIAGGSERQNSVLHGLRALPKTTRLALIHDAARPLVTQEAIRLLVDKARESGAACLARRITDTIKQVRPSADLALDAFILRTIDRSHLWAMETPQVFERSLILAAYEKAEASRLTITDDTAALEATGHPVALVESTTPNPKLTTASDLAYMEFLIKSRIESLQ